MNQEKSIYRLTLDDKKIKKFSNVFITPFAYMFSTKMCELHHLEVGWDMCIKFDDRGNPIITVPFYPENGNVSAAHCRYSNKGQADLAVFFRKRKLNNERVPFRCWAHSHGSMGTFASSQDVSTITDLASKNKWYYRLIMNKKREMNLDIYYTDEKGTVLSKSCSCKLLPWHLEIEKKVYSDILDTEDMKSYIEKLKKEYNYPVEQTNQVFALKNKFKEFTQKNSFNDPYSRNHGDIFDPRNWDKYGSNEDIIDHDYIPMGLTPEEIAEIESEYAEYKAQHVGVSFLSGDEEKHDFRSYESSDGNSRGSLLSNEQPTLNKKSAFGSILNFVRKL